MTLVFCEKCGTKANVSARFCSGCGSEIQAAEKTSDLVSTKARDSSWRKIVLSFGVAGLLGCLTFATMQVPSIRASFDNFLNPVPEKVFIQLAKPAANRGWLQWVTLEVQLESNKPNSYQAVLEIKNGAKWKSSQIMNVTFNQDDMVAKKLSFFSYIPKPGTSELRVKVMRDQGSQELVEISESVKVRILKMPKDMQIANDSNNTIVWRIAKENEKPQYCAKYNRCRFFKVASTKRCTIKAVMPHGKVASINNASKSSIGSVAAYTPKKPYLIEVPSNNYHPSISARCFALGSGSNQGSIPTPTKKPQNPGSNATCSRINQDIASAKRNREMYRPIDPFPNSGEPKDYEGTWSYSQFKFYDRQLDEYYREAELFGC